MDWSAFYRLVEAPKGQQREKLLLRWIKRIPGPSDPGRKERVDQRADEAYPPVEHSQSDPPDKRDGKCAKNKRWQMIGELSRAEKERRNRERIWNHLIGCKISIKATFDGMRISAMQHTICIQDHCHLIRAERHRV